MSGVAGRSGVYERVKKAEFRPRTCVMCGREFLPTSGPQAYCGSERKKTGCSYVRMRDRVKEKIAADREGYLLMLKTHHLYNKYRIRLPDKLRMMEKQAGKCAICRSEFAGVDSAHVDHDHATGSIRGILCGSCNRGLGMFKDSPELLALAAQYLQNDH